MLSTTHHFRYLHLPPFLQSCISSARIHRRYGRAPPEVKLSRRARLEEAMKPDSGALRPHPLSTLTLTGLEPGGRIEQALQKYAYGFDECLNLIGKTSLLHYEYYDPKQLIYLTPDSNRVLQEVRSDVIYVLGGIVDLTIVKRLTENMAREQQLVSARLPIPETMSRSNKGCGNHVHLSLNIVVGVLMTVYSGSSWSEALSCFLPRRTGYDTLFKAVYDCPESESFPEIKFSAITTAAS